MRMLMICCFLSVAAACFAQGTVPPSVVVGQNADGQNLIVTVIPLKFLDPVVAANLLAALGYPGTIIPVNPPHRPGESIGAYQGGGNQFNRPQSNRRGSSGNRQNGRNGSYDGYGGYQDANRTNQQNPGYQSPYDYH